MQHVSKYSPAPAWRTILGERHPLHDGCRVLFRPTFHDVACITIERIEGLAVVRLRSLRPSAADMFFWSGGRLLSPGPDDVRPLAHALFEAPIADDRGFFAIAAGLDPSGSDEDRCARDGMPTTTTLWRDGSEIAAREENTPQGQHLTLVLRALELATAHLLDPRACACLVAVRGYLE